MLSLVFSDRALNLHCLNLTSSNGYINTCLPWGGGGVKLQLSCLGGFINDSHQWLNFNDKFLLTIEFLIHLLYTSRTTLKYSCCWSILLITNDCKQTDVNYLLQSTGDSLDDEDDEELLEAKKNTSYNEVIDADNPQTPAEVCSSQNAWDIWVVLSCYTCKVCQIIK